MCFVFTWEQTATCATYSINWSVFITEMKSVYSAVRTGSLNKTVCASSLKVNIATTVRSAHTVFMCFVFTWEQTATCATYSINWSVFITEMNSVYSAVRTGSLNKAFCASSLKGFVYEHILICHCDQNYGECCSRVRSNGKAGPFNTASGVSTPSNNLWQ